MASFANYLRQKLRGARRNDKANEEVNEVEDQRRWLRAWLRGQKPAGSILWASENVAESPLLHPLPCLPLGYQQNEADSYHYYDPIKNLKVTNKVTRNIWYSECVSCLQVETRGIVVSLREDNRMINGTYLLMTTALVDGFQIMKTLVDIQPQRVVQREPSPFNGTWIPYEQALAIANSEGIAEMLYPLFANSPPGVSYRSGSQTSWQTQDSSLLSTVGSSAPSSSAYNWSLNSSGSGYCTSSALTTPERSPDNTCDASEEPYQVAFGEPSHTSREYHMNPGCPVALPFEYHGREVDQGRDVLPIPHPESELGQKVGSELHLLDPSSIDNEPVTMLQEIHQAQHPPTLTPPSTKSFSIRRKPLNQSPTIEVSIEHEAESRSSTGESSLQSSLSSSSSSSSSSSDELRLHSKEGQKKVLLNRLMGYFYEVFFSSPMRSTSFTRHGTSSEQSDPQSKDSSTSTSMTSASVASGYLGTSQASGKRRASGEEDREQEEEGRPPQRRRGKDIQDSPVDKLTKRLACPYFKMDSARYRATRACIGPGWKSVHRIK